ncbi:hypothetical protein CPB84DRAFT_1775803 [Gymnopilus junonius]|uniref:Uncharacterized protein n=1 Tax=Gymnopilus junonius TaxID=109634 RepID=A0A9P5NRL0_GYMJU|nr:hypothetical protein CPB84DRAFT_1775803 [Gymnopilus junonius]
MTSVSIFLTPQMKQISYLTIVFLPASFVAVILFPSVQRVFGMNVKEIVPQTPNGVPHYVAVAIPFTLATIWIITSFQSKFFFPPEHLNFWKKMMSPLLLLPRLFGRKPPEEKGDVEHVVHEA